MNCECGSTDLKTLDSGTSDTGIPWAERECQDCGSVFFEDHAMNIRIDSYLWYPHGLIPGDGPTAGEYVVSAVDSVSCRELVRIAGSDYGDTVRAVRTWCEDRGYRIAERDLGGLRPW